MSGLTAEADASFEATVLRKLGMDPATYAFTPSPASSTPSSTPAAAVSRAASHSSLLARPPSPEPRAPSTPGTARVRLPVSARYANGTTSHHTGQSQQQQQLPPVARVVAESQASHKERAHSDVLRRFEQWPMPQGERVVPAAVITSRQPISASQEKRARDEVLRQWDPALVDDFSSMGSPAPSAHTDNRCVALFPAMEAGSGANDVVHRSPSDLSSLGNQDINALQLDAVDFLELASPPAQRAPTSRRGITWVME